jgi:catechol 2,3-dioxygenase|tara:strand:- start:341 stop:1180 length:840 start_codon:yes stop_codon:yes gene_type:complete
MKQTALLAGAYLHHLCFESPNPEKLSDFYGKIMQMKPQSIGGNAWLCSGKNRQILIKEGMKNRLEFAAFSCRDEEGLNLLKERVKEEGIEVINLQPDLFQNDAISIVDQDGHNISFGLSKPNMNAESVLNGPLQHLTFSTLNVEKFVDFYVGKLGFCISDRVLHSNGNLATCFVRSNHEHHTVACFKSDRIGVDHHSYEAGEWNVIRDWCDHFASMNIELMWGPGRHGPGNNLFVFVEDPDGNWIEISAELEVIHGRPSKDWPQEERTLNLWGKAILRS